MRTPGAVALRTSAIDSATTSNPSGFSRVMPISVSVPNWMSMIGFCQGGALGSRRHKARGDDGGVGWRGMLDGAGTLFAIRRPVRAEADDVARIEVRQFQPIFGDVAGRKEIILAVFPLERVEQVLLRDWRLLL